MKKIVGIIWVLSLLGSKCSETKVVKSEENSHSEPKLEADFVYPGINEIKEISDLPRPIAASFSMVDFTPSENYKGSHFTGSSSKSLTFEVPVKLEYNDFFILPIN